MKKADVFEFYRRLAEANPSPETELEYANPYTLLVAVVLSAQSTDVGVNKATRALFGEVTTPQQMVALGEEELKRHIKTIGLFNTKAKNVIALSQALIDRYGGEVPRTLEDLEALALVRVDVSGGDGALGHRDRTGRSCGARARDRPRRFVRSRPRWHRA